MWKLTRKGLLLTTIMISPIVLIASIFGVAIYSLIKIFKG